MTALVIKTHYSASELAALNLPGLPTTRQAWEYRAQREAWAVQEVRARGGRGGIKKEYLVPAEVQDTIRQQLAKQLLEQAPAVAVATPATTLPVPAADTPAALATWQRECAEARLAFVREIQRLQAILGKEKAVQEIIARASTGALREPLQGLVKVANAKAGESRTLSRRRLFDWCSTVEKAGEQSPIALLAPKARKSEIPAWAGPLLKAWAQPQKPPLTDVLETLKQQLPPGVPLPSYHQANRFLTQRMGKVDVMRGRMGARELANIRPFVRRDTSTLQPTDIYTADGHCFDAEVAHPKHGRPFRPEVTGVVDVGTRRLVGWSCDLAESRWAVLDALRMASSHYGIAALFYVDNGSGYKNDLMQAEGIGLMARLGTSMTHSIEYNSKARGVIERSHQSIWIRAARKLPTYIGADMDPEAKKKVFKLTRADVLATGRSRLLMPWPEFVAFIAAEADAYNNRPHRGLPRITDPVTLKQRHLTPNEMWAEAVDAGFEAVLPTAIEADDLFRPYTHVNVRRGEIQLFSNRYFARALEQYHGEQLQAGYDIRDPQFLWVRDLDGRFICRAELNANRKPYMPRSVIERAEEKREQGRLKRLETKIEEIHLERNPGVLLEHLESVHMPGLDLSRELLAQRRAEIEAMPIEAAPAWAPRATPIPDNVIELEETAAQKYARWKALNERVNAGNALSEEERNFWSLFPHSDLFQLLREQEEGELGLRQQARV